MISLFRSRNGLRYYLFRGIGLSILLVLGIFGEGAWQVYHTGSQPLPGHVRADAALVLGAAAWDKRPSPIFRERINHAITLYQSHRVEKIVFTGGTPKKGYMTEAEVGRRYALKQGIPAHNILFENTSRNTYENIRNIRPILRAAGIECFIIVSDPYHLDRALEIASDLDIEAYISATPTTRFDQSKEKNKFLLQESYALFLYRIGKWSENFWDWLTVRETKEEA